MLNNSVYYFITENYEVTGNHKDHCVVSDVLYEDYKDFCHKVGAKGIFKKPVFGKEIRKIFLKDIDNPTRRFNGASTRVWSGIRKKDDISQYSPDELAQGITWND